MKTLFLGLILATAAAGAAAQGYRWVDDKGKVHYGDRPPSSVDASLPGTRSAKPRSEPVMAGMRAEEVWELFGRPDDVRKVARGSDAQYWWYRKPKGQTLSYTIKIENGTVTEVVSEPVQQAAGNVPPQDPQQSSGAGPALAAGTTVTAAGGGPSQQASAETTRAQQCAALKESIRSATTAMRRGGSSQQMDQWRDERRANEQKLSALGC